MYRLISAALVMAAIPSTAHAAQSSPSAKWEVEYSASACTAKRQFGRERLAIQLSPMGEWARLYVEGPGRIKKVQQYDTTIAMGGDAEPIKSTSLIYPMENLLNRGIMTIVSVAELERIYDAGRFSLRAGGPVGSRKTFSNRELKATSADLALSDLNALRSAMDTCVADLRKHWGFEGNTYPSPAVPAQAKVDLFSLFKSEDYPADAAFESQAGRSRYALLLDQSGKVVDCAIVESSGIASLDAMGCRIFVDRAKFDPARDSSGKPTRSLFTTPPVRWMIDR